MSKRISHWIDGGTSSIEHVRAHAAPVLEPGDGRAAAAVDLATVAEVDRAVASAVAAFPAWRATNLSGAPRCMFHIRELVAANRKEIASLLTAEHGKVLSRRARRGGPRAGEHRVRLRRAAPAQGRVQRAGLDRRRRLQHPPAARCRRRHHAVQLPGDGPDVDVRQRARLRQHVRAQAAREGSVGVAVHRRAAEPGRAARRLLQRRARRQGRRRRDPRAPRHRRRQLRRLHADRQVHLRDRHPQRQAGAGPRRGQEPHAGAARRRPRHGRRRRGVRRRTARPASGAWRSASCSRSSRSPTRWSTRSRSGMPGDRRRARQRIRTARWAR